MRGSFAAQIWGLLLAILATKDVVNGLRITAKETIERIRERKRQGGIEAAGGKALFVGVLVLAAERKYLEHGLTFG